MTTRRGVDAGPGDRAFLSVGSNLAPEENVPAALGLLLATPGVEITGISTFYWTPPLAAPGAPADSVAGDPDFLNGVVEIRTSLDPESLAEALGTIETALGRVPSEDRYAPRTLDLDLLLYESHPHPPHRDIRARPWVALPLLELAPDLRLPPDGISLAEVARAFPDPGGPADEALTQRLRQSFLAEDRAS
jgi:2-amino-4-hydroxy-6-hydroxymethyldihydropteridine diphosphokinase